MVLAPSSIEDDRQIKALGRRPGSKNAGVVEALGLGNAALLLIQFAADRRKRTERTGQVATAAAGVAICPGHAGHFIDDISRQAKEIESGNIKAARPGRTVLIAIRTEGETDADDVTHLNSEAE
jgi:hypothetical protein